MNETTKPEIYRGLTDLNEEVFGQLIYVEDQARIVEVFEDIVTSRNICPTSIKHISGPLYDLIN